MAQRPNRRAWLATLAAGTLIAASGALAIAGALPEEPAVAPSLPSEPQPADAAEGPAPGPAASATPITIAQASAPLSPPTEQDARTGVPERAPVGASVRDCEVCPELVQVPVGEYMMGAPGSDKDANAGERPQHRVRIERPFLAGRYEVTFGQWDACVAEKGCSHRPDDFGWGREDRPVMLVGWDDVRDYLAWVSAKAGKPYRLLSEAEWEYAHRAGTATRYWWGDAAGTGNANCKGCGSRWDDRQTAPVGSFQPNPFGLYDTSGNVWEWVEDCWAEGYKSAGGGAGAFQGAGPCERRVLRGGSWINKPGNLRSSARAWGAPEGRVNIVGFRVARDP